MDGQNMHRQRTGPLMQIALMQRTVKGEDNQTNVLSTELTYDTYDSNYKEPSQQRTFNKMVRQGKGPSSQKTQGKGPAA